MQNPTVHLGSATPLSSRAGPRAPVLSTAPTDRLAPPASGTTTRYCAVAHPSAPSLPRSVRPACARVVHVARERHARAAAGRRPLVGTSPHGTPTPGTPTFSLLFPLCRAAAEPLAPRSRCSTRPPIPTPLRLLLSSARASPPLPAPGPPPPATGSPLSLADSGQAPPPSATPLVSSSPSCQSPIFFVNPSLPRLSRAAGLHHPRRRPPEPPPRRRTPPPDAVCTTLPSTRRSGVPLSSPPCPAHSP
jgi:hypothetical protein